MTDITTTVTFDDMIDAYDDELADFREAYEEIVDYAEAEYGADRPEWPQELIQLAAMYEEAGKQIQQRQHVLERLAEAYDGDRFDIKMLTGAETMDLDTQLRAKAQERNMDPQLMQAYRKQLTVDRATVAAPDGFPTDGDDSPKPSDAPNPLTFALYEQVERLNQAGSTDFRAPGFGDADSSIVSGMSEAPSSAGPASSSSATSSAEMPDDWERPGDS